MGNRSHRSNPNRRRVRGGLILAFACVFVFSTRLAAATGLPIVQHVDGGATQAKGAILSLAQTGDGSLFAGSNQLAVFDGYRWERIPIPGAYGFRALVAAEDAARVWVGAVGAVGFVSRVNAATWSYTSLLPQLERAGVAHPGDIWSVHATTGGAVFVLTHHVARWDGARFEVWPLPATPRLQAFAGRDGRVWIFQQGVGLLQLDPAQPPRLVRAASELPPAPIVWALEGPRREAPLAGMLLGTTDGVYRPVGAEVTALPNLTSAVRENFPTHAVALTDEMIAIGTFKAGVVIGTRSDVVAASLDAACGLPDDSINALASAGRDQLWVAPGSGLARIDGVGHASLFDRRTEIGLGAPRKVVAAGGQTFVLTEKDFLALGDRPVPVLAAQPLLRDAVSHDGALWVGGFGGIWRVADLKATHEHHVSADVLQLLAIRSAPHEVLFTEGYALKALVPSRFGWVARELGVKLGDTPVSLVEDANGSIWISTVRDGVRRMELRREAAGHPRLRVVAHLREGNGLPRGAGRAWLSVHEDRVLAFTEAGILAFDERSNDFARVAGAEVFVGLAAVAAGERGSAWWIARRTDLGEGAPPVLLRARIASERVELTPFAAPGLDTIGEIVRIDTTADAGAAVLWISGTRGILKLDALQLQPASPLAGTRWRSVDVDGERTAAIGTLERVAFRPELKRLEFHFPAAEALRGDVVLYQTRLDGVEPAWSAPQRAPSREFTGLAPGGYSFAARAVDRFGRATAAALFRFEVIAPWYRRGPAVAGYVVLAGLSVAALVRLRLQRLQRQTEKLNRLVAERTRHLELVNTAKSEFLENISHEIRNPLAGIIGLSRMFKEERLEPRERDLARSLKASAEHLRRVSEEVLEFSKLEYGEITLDEKPFQLRALLDELVALYQPAAQQHGNTLSIASALANDDRFVSDEAKIRTIVGNFVSNALKYAPGTAVELRAECEPGDVATSAAEGPRASVIISVTDRGPGIPPDEQELIFQKFVRGAAAKQHRVAGNGIGLAACRVLARSLGGSVGVDSEPGLGATFHVWLPLKRTAPPPSTQHGGEGGAGSALIVEDESYNRIVLRGTAEQLGYRVATAADPAEALRLIECERFDVIFLDWELPGLKGEHIAERLRARPGGDEPLVIATTAHDSADVRRRCRAAGMDEFLLKPFTAEQVRRLIDAAREPRRAGRRAVENEPVAAPAGDELNLEAFALYARTTGAGHAPREPISDFFRAIERETTALRSALEQGDRVAIKSAAHRLRALGALVNARSLNAAARRLDEAAGVRTAAAELVRLEQELAGECVALRERLADATPRG